MRTLGLPGATTELRISRQLPGPPSQGLWPFHMWSIEWDGRRGRDHFTCELGGASDHFTRDQTDR